MIGIVLDDFGVNKQNHHQNDNGGANPHQLTYVWQ